MKSITEEWAAWWCWGVEVIFGLAESSMSGAYCRNLRNDEEEIDMGLMQISVSSVTSNPSADTAISSKPVSTRALWTFAT